MNRDFHYEGTYCAAVLAGFNPADAAQIAWAAQMVDDCTESLLSQTNVQGIATCMTELEMLSSDLKYAAYDPASNETLKKIRRIWMHFHFLPGNLPDGSIQQAYTGPAASPVTMGGTDFDSLDFLCLCRHNSTLAETMISNTVNRYAQADGVFSNRTVLLNLIGIRMHVLADTWAHEFFVGTPNDWINDVKDIRIEKGELSISSRLNSIPAPTHHSLLYLGHGRIGHLPDLGFVRYSYQPIWLNQKIIRFNPGIFLHAFCQMVEAMRSILTHTNFVLKEYSDAEVIQCLTLPTTNAVAELLISKHKNADENDWLSLEDPNCPNQSLISGLAKYNPGASDLNLFQQAAMYHYDMVSSVLRSYGIPGF